MSKIKAGTTSGTALVTEGDTTGQLVFQTNGTTTALTLGTDQSATFVGNVAVNGTLTASSGLPSLASPLTVTGNNTAGAEIRLPEDTDNGSNYVALKAPNALAANLTLTLPTADGTSGQVLQTDGSGTLSFATPAAGSLLRIVVFTSSGTWTKGAGTNYIRVRGVGGGGGGGGGSTNTTCGSGGGAGGYFEKLISTSGVTTVAVTIGAAGSGAANSANGTAGGNTTFGAYCTGNGGAGGTTQATSSNGGAGGTATGGDINIPGGGGCAVLALGSVQAPSQPGGVSVFGFPPFQVVNAAVGNSAGYGTGGSGGSSGGSGQFGGNGAKGIVIVEEYA